MRRESNEPFNIADHQLIIIGYEIIIGFIDVYTASVLFRTLLRINNNIQRVVCIINLLEICSMKALVAIILKSWSLYFWKI